MPALGEKKVPVSGSGQDKEAEEWAIVQEPNEKRISRRDLLRLWFHNIVSAQNRFLLYFGALSVLEYLSATANFGLLEVTLTSNIMEKFLGIKSIQFNKSSGQLLVFLVRETIVAFGW